MSNKIIVNSDGGCRNNPGAGAWSYIVDFGQNHKVTGGGFVEYATVNELEYMAVTEAAQFLLGKCLDLSQIEFRSDSQLIVRQLNGEWGIKQETLRPFFERALAGIAGLSHQGHLVRLTWIPREQNTETDAICGKIQDEHGVVGRPNPKKIRA